jgi:hypothetical protein
LSFLTPFPLVNPFGSDFMVINYRHVFT